MLNKDIQEAFPMSENKGLFQLNEHRSAFVSLKVTPSEKEWLCSISAQRQLNISQLILYALNREYARLSKDDISVSDCTELCHTDNETAENSSIDDDWLYEQF
jgi:hypothetical protein